MYNCKEKNKNEIMNHIKANETLTRLHYRATKSLCVGLFNLSNSEWGNDWWELIYTMLWL